MVGKQPERDIAGARDAGIASIWLKVLGSEEYAAVEPDFTIMDWQSYLRSLRRSILDQLNDRLKN
jgi:FMN phosphatase YigB (HAD superfamily)